MQGRVPVRERPAQNKTVRIRCLRTPAKEDPRKLYEDIENSRKNEFIEDPLSLSLNVGKISKKAANSGYRRTKTKLLGKSSTP